MLLNGLGVTSRPMYLSPQFFANKPLDLLIGPGIEASDLASAGMKSAKMSAANSIQL